MDCITAARGAIVKAFGLPRSYNTSLEYIQLIISILIKIKTINYYYYLYPKSDQHLTSNNNIILIIKLEMITKGELRPVLIVLAFMPSLLLIKNINNLTA